ncbi:MAG: helicase-exonuclease AddAB subunit AddB [Clostridia bacterium]|nr:helicase-exonuclease AddAB subunit AddB [Clostridia bacterium]
MSLKIVYGTSGTGKSNYLFEEIAQKLRQNDRKIYIITPEQFSFTLEQKLLEVSEHAAVLQAEVLTFKRMAYRILNEVGGTTKTMLTESGRSMLLSHILFQAKGELSFLGKSEENVELLERQITELKKHHILPESLQEVIRNTQNRYLQEKLKDISLIYEKYTESMLEKYIDENDTLDLLAMELEEAQDFKSCDIYIDEFAGFTPQEYAILRILLKISHEVTITVCTDSLTLSENADTDVFYANKKTVEKLLNLAKEEEVPVSSKVHLSEAKRFHTPELQHIAQNLVAPFYTKYEEKPTNLSLFLANNPYSEIEHIAMQIVKLVKEENYHYQEISVITQNTDQYASLCKAIFAQYQIPIFIDQKKDLTQNILVKLVISLLEVFAKNWSYEAVFGYLKTNFTSLSKEEISYLENYCLKWGIKGNKWYDKEWNFYDETEEEKQKILYYREQTIQPLLQFKAKLKGVKTVKEITKAIYEFLLENQIDQKLQEKAQQLEELGELEIAKEYETSWKILMDLFDEIVLVLGDTKVSFDLYQKILKMGLKSSSLGKIPGTADQVIVGNIDRSRTHKVKAMFIIGMNDGAFPNTQKDEGFLDDQDREILKEQGMELAKGTMEQLYDDNFNIYKAFTTAEEKLFLSYVSSDSEGKSLRPSMFIHKMKRMFPTLEETSDIIERPSEILLSSTTLDELLMQLRKLCQGEEIELKWFAVYQYYEKSEPKKLQHALQALQRVNQLENLEKETLQKLYGTTLKTSVSRLEQFEACAFSYYLKYGLKLQEKDTLKVEAVDTGSFMHEVIDRFFEIATEEGKNVKQMTDEEVKEATEQIVENLLQEKRYYIFNAIPKYRVLAGRLKRVIAKSMKYIVDSLKYSEFEVLGHELEFKAGKEYPPIVFELQDGKKVEITGKIDRVDIAKTADGNYIRIIDYKSSSKNINLNEVVAGLQLQLLTYLDATCKEENVLPAGVLYFHLLDPILNSDKNLSEEEITEELRKQFKMQGLILADSQIIRKMDTTLEKGNSNIIPAYLTKDGEVSNKPSTITREQFENLQKYTEKIIKQISNEILEGNIEITPYYQIQTKKTPCQYCSYKSICQFNQITKDSYRYIPNFDKDTILEKIKE